MIVPFSLLYMTIMTIQYNHIILLFGLSDIRSDIRGDIRGDIKLKNRNCHGDYLSASPASMITSKMTSLNVFFVECLSP